MNIQLNITSNRPIPKQKNSVENEHKLSKKFKRDEEFNFEFSKANNAKAIFRRRKMPKCSVPKDINMTTEKPAMQKKKNYVLIKHFSDSDDDQEVLPVNNSNEINLSLNIYNKHPNVQNIPKKEKPSRNERKDSKRKVRNYENVKADDVVKGIKNYIEKVTKKPQKSNIKKTVQSKKSNLFSDKFKTETLGQRLVTPITEEIFSGAPLQSINLHPHCIKNLSDILNITELTTVQQRTIPKALEGHDILVRSQTGSGKTLAYALPLVQKLQEIRPKLTRNCGIMAVIIVPTRELAIQTYELFIKLLKPFTWIVPGFLTGGEKRKAEKARLRKGINILVGTPGRLCDHLLHTESFKLDKCKFLILDEADRLLEMGYEKDVKQIVQGIHEHKKGVFKKMAEGVTNAEDNFEITNKNSDLQSLLLSATLTSAVQKLAGLALKTPIFIDTSNNFENDKSLDSTDVEQTIQDAVDDEKLVIPATMDLRYLITPTKLRLVTLSALLATENKKDNLKALVFMSTMEMVNFHYDLLNETLTRNILDDEDDVDISSEDDVLLQRVRLFKLHGSLTQNERSGVFKAFKECKCGILFATDVAGRGIDVPTVNLVVQYSPPQKIPEFVHRVGRTARAGKSGRAVIFLGPNEIEFVRVLENKRIRISQTIMEDYLKVLIEKDSRANNIQDAASNLQFKFEETINDDDELYEKACKAFASWIRFYSTFPKDLKHIFNAKTAHMGHFAKSFGLREQPKNFVKKHMKPKPMPATNRLTYSERDPEKIKTMKMSNKKSTENDSKRKLGNKLFKIAAKSSTLGMSEFDSGLSNLKKRKIK